MCTELFKREKWGVVFAYIWTSILCTFIYWLLVRVGRQPYFLANVVAGGTWVIMLLAMTLGFKKRYALKKQETPSEKKRIMQTAIYAGIFSWPGFIFLILSIRKMAMEQPYLPFLLTGMFLMLISSSILFFKLRPLRKQRFT